MNNVTDLATTDSFKLTNTIDNRDGGQYTKSGADCSKSVGVVCAVCKTYRVASNLSACCIWTEGERRNKN